MFKKATALPAEKCAFKLFYNDLMLFSRAMQGEKSFFHRKFGR